ncbi:MAG: hypothetical protein WCP32_14160 [Bacteroidota bacterium]
MEKIKSLAGEAWALVADPVFSAKNGELKSGILLYFSRDKQDVHEFILHDKQRLIKHYTILFTGKKPAHQVYVL